MPNAPQARECIRVPFVDIDSSQRIHFTAFFRYMEVTEHTLMRSLGLPYSAGLLENAFPRVHLECDFKGAIHYDDLLELVATVERVGTSSWTVGFAARQLEGAQQGELVATGRMTIVSMNPVTERSAPLPDQLRRALLGE